jgi:mono/diheme cytochrome c family protein
MLRSFWFALALVACGNADETDTDVLDTDADADTDTDSDTDTDTDSDTDTDTAGAPTYADIQAITSSKCSGCHGTSGGLTLTGDWHADVVGADANQLASMSLIEPGDPDQSYLVLKVRGTHTAAGGTGEKMPKGGSLSADQIADLEAWITAGATK